ncbi:MAG: [Selenomonadaceae bacterium]|nr:[FeFe] hydrogenase H-cluster radical SAM maturase HydE [Selenomonadaceae bacterium]
MHSLIQKAARSHRLSLEELTFLLSAAELTEDLAAAADEARKRYVGDGVHLRGLIEFSNICRQNCCYCGLRRDNQHLQRYRLEPTEIVKLAENAKALGFATIVVQGGEDVFFTAEILAEVVTAIKKLDVAVTLSVGERSRQDYQLWREAGADRYLLRIETTDASLYEKLDPGMSHANRRRCLQDLKELGYEVGTGSLVGLPGQGLESLAQDILFFQEIDADMLGIGPFIPNPDTPLGHEPPGDFPLTRRMVSLIRLLIPDANIPATTAMGTILPGGREIALASGANVVMPNVTVGEARLNYALYPGKICANDSPAKCRSCMEGRLRSMGRFVATGQGFRQRNTTERGLS